MQLKILVWMVGSLAAVLVSLQAQTAPASKNDAQAQDLLRRAAAQQQQQTGTSKETPPPAKPAPASAPLVTNTPLLSVGHPTRAELDQQYIDGRLTAKQFQKALDAWMKEEIKRSTAGTEKQRNEAAQRRQVSKPPPPTRAASPKDSAATPAAAVNAPPVTSPAPPTDPTPQQAKISEVEARIDAMLRQKEAREKAALTNAAATTNNLPAGPQTKRQRMDALLRQLVEGTLSEAEYNARRAKIVAEPD